MDAAPNGRRVARERVDYRKHAQLAASRQLVMDKVHRPGFVRLRGRSPVYAQLRRVNDLVCAS
jgi:hypothetical protein